ncbi:Zn-dependent hydrolase [Ensifer soli]|uniref:Zn-dependent hydrolase n=1 Tax=Ciceribacter sp. sgz301302 TaxID=3342379 RepID=UPI0035BB3ABF
MTATHDIPAGFEKRFETFSEIGSTGDGGVHRMESSAANGEARRQLVAWLREEGFEVRIDGIGNIFGILDLGAGADAPLIMAGSHIDSQPMGGRFDGAYGVIAGLDAALAVRDRLKAAGTTPVANLAVVAFSGEEGARFFTFMGSKVYTGQLTAEETLAQRDADGVLARDAMEAIGFIGTDAAPPFPRAYVELHVECGSYLEDKGVALGVFDRWWGAHKLDVHFIGETSHTGPTPMAKRRDALYAAAQMITGVRGLADAAPVGDLHTSVAKLLVAPNSRNVVPDSALGFVEIRSMKPEVMEENVAKLMPIIETAAAVAGVGHEIVRDDLRRPGRFDEELGQLADAIAVANFGIEPMHIDTLPGHDAIMMMQVTRCLMLTVPSRGGLCHHPDEYSDMGDLKRGAAWLAAILERLVLEPPAPKD